MAKELKLNDLLSALDEAATVYSQKSDALTKENAAQAQGVQKAQAAFDATKAELQGRVNTAAIAADEARRVLDGLKDQVNARIGLLTGGTDARVSVR